MPFTSRTINNKLETVNKKQKFQVSSFKFLVNSGFTLIELLVVITIIGTLISIATVAFNNAQEKGRDTRRKNDLSAIKSALTLYFEDNYHYPEPGEDDPVADSTGGDSWIPGLAPQYIQKLPKDPKQAGLLGGLAKFRPSKPQVASAVSLKDSSGYYVGINNSEDPLPDNILINKSVVSGYVLVIPWEELNPQENIYDWKSIIEARKAEMIAKGGANWRGEPKKLALRVFPGERAPWWLKTQKKGSTTFGATTLTDAGANFGSNCLNTNLADGRNLEVAGHSSGVKVKSVSADKKTLFVGNFVDDDNNETTPKIWIDGWYDADNHSLGTPAAGSDYTVGGCVSNKGVQIVNYGKGELPRAIPMVTDRVMLGFWDTFLANLAAEYENDPLISRITLSGPAALMAESYLTDTIVKQNQGVWLLPETCTETVTACRYTMKNIVAAWQIAINSYQKYFDKTPYNFFHSAMPNDLGNGKKDDGWVTGQIHEYAGTVMEQNGFYIPGANFLSTKVPDLDNPTADQTIIWRMIEKFYTDTGVRSGFQAAGNKLSDESCPDSPPLPPAEDAACKLGVVLQRAVSIHALWLEIWPGMVTSELSRTKLEAYKEYFAPTPPTPTPTPSPTPTPTATPEPSPSPSPSPTPTPGDCSSQGIYCYVVAANLESYTLWA